MVLGKGEQSWVRKGAHVLLAVSPTGRGIVEIYPGPGRHFRAPGVHAEKEELMWNHEDLGWASGCSRRTRLELDLPVVQYDRPSVHPGHTNYTLYHQGNGCF